jgi:hypothetical protein
MKKMTPEELEQFIHRELRALPSRKAPAGFEARLQAAVEAHTTRSALAPEQLEQLVHRELRALPARRAPRTLEARVLAAIEHQAAVVWYHKSWSYWPAAIRAAFLVVATSVTGAVVAAFYLGLGNVENSAVASEAVSRFDGLVRLGNTFSGLVDFASMVIRNIPSLWLYGGAAFVMLMYATFFGLGAAAYRTLYRNNA